jgi:hypothetical protein
MAAKKNWDVKMEKLGKKNYRTVFRVNNQYFTLSQSDEREHCLFTKRMFLKAIANMEPRRRREKRQSQTSRPE